MPGAESDMTEIEIPESGHAAFRAVLTMSDSAFEALLRGISEVPPAATKSIFAEAVASKSELPRETVEPIVNELFPLNEAPSSWELSIADFATMIAQATFEQTPKGSSLTEEQRDLLASRLAQLLQHSAPIRISSKAEDILTDTERVFYSAKVLTDVRPVFDEEGKRVQAAVLLHNLRIHFGQENDHRNFFVTLDTGDIKLLRDVLDRADQKAEALEALLRAAKVPYLNPSSE